MNELKIDYKSELQSVILAQQFLISIKNELELVDYIATGIQKDKTPEELFYSTYTKGDLYLPNEKDNNIRLVGVFFPVDAFGEKHEIELKDFRGIFTVHKFIDCHFTSENKMTFIHIPNQEDRKALISLDFDEIYQLQISFQGFKCEDKENLSHIYAKSVSKLAKMNSFFPEVNFGVKINKDGSQTLLENQKNNYSLPDDLLKNPFVYKTLPGVSATWLKAIRKNCTQEIDKINKLNENLETVATLLKDKISSQGTTETPIETKDKNLINNFKQVKLNTLFSIN